MIVRTHEGGVRTLVDQVSHARISGELADAWGIGDESDDSSMVEAADHHDDGWRAWDRHPRLNADTGEPHSYRDLPADDHLEIWERTVAAGWQRGTEVGVLISLHGCRFFTRKRRPADRAFLRRERERQAAALGLKADRVPGHLPAEVALHHARMGFVDGLSLFLCDRWDSPWRTELPGTAVTCEVVMAAADGAPEPWEVRVCPYPFRRPLRLQVQARRVRGMPFASQGALDRAVDGAEMVTLRWWLRAG